MPTFATTLTLPTTDTGFTSAVSWIPTDRRNNLFFYREQATSAGYNLGYKSLASSLSVQVWPATKQQPLHKVRLKGVQPFSTRAADGVTVINSSATMGSFDLLVTAPAAAFVSDVNMLNRLLYAFIKTYGLSFVQSLVRDQEGMM